MNARSEKLSYKQVRKAATVETLVAAGETVMCRRGYHAATMQDIAHEAGCAAGTLYLYFKNKEELYLDMVTRHTDAIVSLLTLAMSKVDEPVEKLKVKTHALVDYFNEHREYFRVSFTEAPGGRADIKSNLRDDALKAYLDYKRIEQKVVRQGQRLGLLRTDINAEELVEFIHGTSASTLARWSTSPQAPKLGTQRRLLWSFLSAGLGAKGDAS